MKIELSKIEPYCAPALRAFVRAVRMEDGAVWFTGGDLCKSLLLDNPLVALHSLDCEERRNALLQDMNDGEGESQ